MPKLKHLFDAAASGSLATSFVLALVATDANGVTVDHELMEVAVALACLAFVATLGSIFSREHAR